MDYNFDFDKFEKALKDTQSMSEVEQKAHYILETISPYVDCETNFLLDITEEEIMTAMNFVYDSDSDRLKSMIIAEGAISLTSDLKSIQKAKKQDLF